MKYSDLVVESNALQAEFKASVDNFLDAISKLNSPEVEKEFRAQFRQAKTSFSKSYLRKDDTDAKEHLDDIKSITSKVLKNIDR